MKLKNAMILWNVDTFKICVIHTDTYSRSRELYQRDNYTRSGGCCYTHVKNLNHDECIRYVFITAIHLIVTDKVPFMDVHNALYAIDEYRDGLVIDFPFPD